MLAIYIDHPLLGDATKKTADERREGE